MKNIRAAFVTFWSGFFDRSVTPPINLKAYQSGYAVETALQGQRAPDLPYITYEIARSPFADFTILTGKIWTRGTSWGLVDDVLAQAAEKIPEESGLALDLGADGRIVLYRSTPFADYLPPEDNDPLNKAGVIRIIVKNYVI